MSNTAINNIRLNTIYKTIIKPINNINVLTGDMGQAVLFIPKLFKYLFQLFPNPSLIFEQALGDF